MGTAMATNGLLRGGMYTSMINQLQGVAGEAKNMAEMVKVGAALTSALGYNDGNDGNGPGGAPGVAHTVVTKSNVSPCDDDRAARLELAIK
eukprot:10688263-Karenia_brevis.AAC.1